MEIGNPVRSLSAMWSLHIISIHILSNKDRKNNHAEAANRRLYQQISIVVTLRSERLWFSFFS